MLSSPRTPDQLRPGETALVRRVGGSESLRRLLDMGLVRGAAVTVIKTAPLGDPARRAPRQIVIYYRMSTANAEVKFGLMSLPDRPMILAKITWTDPRTANRREYVLTEGATATIGRMENNDICIPEQHVSRQHAVINYRDGVFVLTDLGSANGTFVNDRRLDAPFPLASGDEIRLYVPVLNFSAAVTAEDERLARQQGTFITPTKRTGRGQLIITTGAQEGQTIPLLINKVTVGRATSKANWEIALQDPAVSRPHAQLEFVDGAWVVTDLGSANGTIVNGTPVSGKGRVLRDGDIISFGATLVLFREG